MDDVEILPSKTVSERITFTVDFMDELPWGSTITDVTVSVRVFSGVDIYPQDVFSRVVFIENTTTTIQLRRGRPGVIYVITVNALVSGIVYSRDFNLAVLTDKARSHNIFPVLLSVTSEPYPQIFYDKSFFSTYPISSSSFINRAGIEVLMQSGESSAITIPINGIISSIYVELGYVVDSIYSIDVPTAGSIDLVKRGYDKVASTSTVRAISGTIDVVPKGFDDATAHITVIPTGGVLSPV